MPVAMPILSRRSFLLIGEETDAGTGVTPSTAVLAYDAAVNPTTSVDDRVPGGFGGTVSGIPGASTASASFRAELRGGGGTGTGATPTPTWLRSLLLACGFAETVTNTFKPSSSLANHKFLTIWNWVDGVYYKANGCAGNVRITAEAGRQAFLEFDFQGVWLGMADVATVPTPASATPKPPRLVSAALALDSYAHKISRLQIDMGNAVAMREDVSAASGMLHAYVGDRRPKLTMDPEATLVATEDLVAMMLAGSEVAFTAAIGSATNNTVTITAPKVQVASATRGDRGGKLIHDLTCSLNASSGDDELSIVFS